MITLESPRLRFREVEADDLPQLLSVYLSNPAFVMMNEGSQGQEGYFDLEMLQRDWQVSQMMPGSHWLSISLKATGEVVGQANYWEEYPDDGMPYLGLLMIHSAYQRQGLGTEAYQRLAEHFRKDLGWATARLGVLTQNQPALAFWRRLGFHPIGSDDAPRRAIILEQSL